MPRSTLTALPYLRGKSNVSWSKKTIAAMKKQVKGELDADAPGEKRQRYLLKAIQEGEEDQSAKGQLRLYVLIMSALVHHEREGGLSPQQVKRFSNYAYAILQTQGIVPITSRLAFLYSELHLVLSQIYRKEGHHFQALWEEQLSFQLAGRDSASHKGLNALATAIRALRLGFGRIALQNYMLAEQSDLPPASFLRARLGLILCLRLTGRLAEAKNLAAETLQQHQLTPAQKLEINWEQACHTVCETGDLSALLAMTQKNASHHYAVYVVETFFWTRATANRQWFKQLPSTATLGRNKNLNPQQLGFYFESAQSIERCYDTEYPYAMRLNRLGETLRQSHGLISIDKELLLWAAAARWLSRSHAFSLASIALSEYQSLCMRLTEGKVTDVLGVMADMVGKDWFQNQSEAL